MAKTSQENIEKLKEIAIKKAIPIYKMMLSETSHKLEQVLWFDPNSEN